MSSSFTLVLRLARRERYPVRLSSTQMPCCCLHLLPSCSIPSSSPAAGTGGAAAPAVTLVLRHRSRTSQARHDAPDGSSLFKWGGQCPTREFSENRPVTTGKNRRPLVRRQFLIFLKNLARHYRCQRYSDWTHKLFRYRNLLVKMAELLLRAPGNFGRAAGTHPM